MAIVAGPAQLSGPRCGEGRLRCCRIDSPPPRKISSPLSRKSKSSPGIAAAADLGIVSDQKLGRAAEEAEHADLGAGPVEQALRPHCFRLGEARCRARRRESRPRGSVRFPDGQCRSACRNSPRTPSRRQPLLQRVVGDVVSQRPLQPRRRGATSNSSGSSIAPHPCAARSRAHSRPRGAAAAMFSTVACSVPASPASPSPRRLSMGGNCLD
jgi:hypothetical protein